MGSKRKKQKNKQKRKSQAGRPAALRALPTPEQVTLPTPEQVIGAILESIAAPFLDSPSGGESEERLARLTPDGETEQSLDRPTPAMASGVRWGGSAISPPRGEEHRAHPRVTVAVAVGLETESHFFAGLSGDVSAGGVFVQTYRDIPVGSDVEVEFDLPDGHLKAHGRVRWHRIHSDSSPPGVGIAFEELGDDDRQVIQRFCEQRAPLYYDVEHG